MSLPFSNLVLGVDSPRIRAKSLLHLSFDLICSICDMLYHVASVVVEWEGRGKIFVTFRAEFNGLLSVAVILMKSLQC